MGIFSHTPKSLKLENLAGRRKGVKKDTKMSFFMSFEGEKGGVRNKKELCLYLCTLFFGRFL